MEIDYKNVKVIGFDADDTLWVNETYFREAELAFSKLMAPYETANKIDQELFKRQIDNLPLYGYGIKGFILSMVEIALELSNNSVNNATISAILNIGKEMLDTIQNIIHCDGDVQNIFPFDRCDERCIQFRDEFVN